MKDLRTIWHQWHAGLAHAGTRGTAWPFLPFESELGGASPRRRSSLSLSRSAHFGAVSDIQSIGRIFRSQFRLSSWKIAFVSRIETELARFVLRCLGTAKSSARATRSLSTTPARRGSGSRTTLRVPAPAPLAGRTTLHAPAPRPLQFRLWIPRARRSLSILPDSRVCGSSRHRTQ